MSRFRRFRRPVALVVLAAAAAVTTALAAACSDEEPGDLHQMTFMAGFRAQANLPFVAVYVADAEGFFADEGLAVDIQHSSGQDEHVRLLLDGAVDVTTSPGGSVLTRASEDLPVRVVALFGQRGDQGYVTRADSDIETPAAFAGHTVGFKAGVVPAELLALLDVAGLDEDDVELVGVGFDPRVFIEGGVEVYPVFLNNEPDTIRRAGLDINVIDPAEFGVPTLGLTYLARTETIEEDRDHLERFLRATFRAVRWIEEHRDEAIEITLEHVPDADPEHQRYLLDTDIEAAQRGDGRTGLWTVEQWQAVADLLLAHEVITEPVDVSALLADEVLTGLYEEGAFE